MRNYLFPLLICCGIFQHKAQYLMKRPQMRDYAGYSFDDRFGRSAIASFELKDLHLYKQKKVEKLLVYSNDSTLLQATELDSSGRIICEGNFDGTYFRTICANGPNAPNTAVSYYLQNRLIRTDTSVHKKFEYKNGDTLMQYDRAEHYVYRSGELLNQQNRLYNEQYYWKRIRVNRKGSSHIYVNRLGWKRRYVVFLKKKFPTDFDSLKIYLASTFVQQTYFYAQIGKVEMDSGALKRHPFFKGYQRIQKMTYHIPGQNFREPYFGFDLNDGWGCSNSNRWRDYPSFTGQEWTYNEKGLQDTYLNLYYPQDTSAAAIANYKLEMERSLKAGAVRVEGMGLYQPRKKTPIVSRLYFVRYEYFE